MAQDQYGNYLLPSGGIGATVVPVIPKVVRINVDNIQFYVMEQSAKQMEQFKFRMQKYPGPKVPTTYDRTELLRDSWFETDQRGIATDVYNTSPYAHFVHGDNVGAGQQQQHVQTGWPNMYAEFQKWKPRVVAAAQEAINREVAAQGLLVEV